MPEKVRVCLGFAELLCRKSDVAKISRIAKRAYSLNRRFFGKEIRKPFHIIICYSRAELDEQWGGKTEDWLTALSGVGSIATFTDGLIKRYSGVKVKSGMRSALEHEINHQFYYQIVGSRKPSWLLEGLATQFGGYRLHGDDKRMLEGELPHLLHFHSGKSYWKHARMLYPMGFAAVRYLIGRHGKAKVLRMLSLYSKKPTKSGFEAAFRKTFGYSVRELEERVFRR